MAMMNDVQSMVVDTATEWVRDRMPVTAFRRLRDERNPLGFSQEAWTEIRALGWCGVALAEEDGGAGLGFTTLGLILEQFGRHLAASPLASTALAADCLVRGGQARLREVWLAGLLSGETIGTLALDETPRHGPECLATTARPVGGGWVLNGTKGFVAEGLAASLYIVSAQAEDGPALFAVSASSEGLSRTPRHLVDHRGYADVVFHEVAVGSEARLSCTQGDRFLLHSLLDRARLLASAELIGVSVGAFEMTMDYLKIREQFGQKIGAFQALQHRSAHLYTRIELARSAVAAGLKSLDLDRPDQAALASLAKATAGDTAHLATCEMIQMHGGIGMTDAHDAGFFLKRSRTLEASWGSSSWHRERYGTLLGL